MGVRRCDKRASVVGAARTKTSTLQPEKPQGGAANGARGQQSGFHRMGHQDSLLEDEREEREVGTLLLCCHWFVVTDSGWLTRFFAAERRPRWRIGSFLTVTPARGSIRANRGALRRTLFFFDPISRARSARAPKKPKGSAGRKDTVQAK
jgi:hypothetical protein